MYACVCECVSEFVDERNDGLAHRPDPVSIWCPGYWKCFFLCAGYWTGLALRHGKGLACETREGVRDTSSLTVSVIHHNLYIVHISARTPPYHTYTHNNSNLSEC